MATATPKVTVPEILRLKATGQKIAALTAYDYPFARILDACGIDVILVGDSVATVVQGVETTLPVTMDEMVYHCKLVTRARPRALVVGDLPFLSYQAGVCAAIANAGRLLKDGGVEAVKLEGGVNVARVMKAIVNVDIPVMAHIGLTPQSVHRMGGFKVQGKKSGRQPGARERLLDDAHAVADAGAFAVVLEGVPIDLAQEITEQLSIPTIGIGAGPFCDGQILVLHDILGLTDRVSPKFVKQYVNLQDVVSQAVSTYIGEVRGGAFPQDQHSFH
ncbi:MAG: 3-methyl-2-oxobutanoate hydroxymethyltransferase [Deltaproteobacteria bacterium]|nr:3-methyl-2-oxobutanoate hydroxymethyltransferase [Deltaproteobacteria bacterium]